MLKNAFRVAAYYCCYCCLYFQAARSSPPSSLPIGAHPLDEKYYDADLISCKDGSKNFKRDRINDNFCDCPDGTDEPGTNACPSGKFYCRNVGSTPKFLFSSRVNDHICDCCDGSDEYDGTTICPNTCVMGGNVAYDSTKYYKSVKEEIQQEAHTNSNMVDSTHKFTGLLLFAFLQMAFVLVILGFRLYRRRQTRRRNSRLI